MQWQNNPLAPFWMVPGFACSDTGDRYFEYLLQQPLAASEQVTSQSFPWDGGECFIWRAAAGTMRTGGEGYLQLKDASGKAFSNEPLSAGWAGQGTWLVVPESVAPGSIWSYDAINADAANAGVLMFLFMGVKRRAGA